MKTIGEKSEALVLAELIKRDISVSLPFGDNQRYDMILDINGNLYKIQVKTCKYKEDVISFRACSSTAHRKNGSHQDYKGQIDYFIAYCHELHKLYLVNVDDVGKAEVTLRLKPSKNGQTTNVRWAEDYEVDNVLKGL